MTTQAHEQRIPEFTQADRLRKSRELTGLNSYDFAEKVGVSQKSINNAESGRTQPRKILLNAWALATGVPLEWLETGQAPRPQPHPGGGKGRARHDSNVRPRDYKADASVLTFPAGRKSHAA